MPEVRTTPSSLDLRVYAGDENRVELEVLAGGTPVDLTGAQIAAQARQTATDTDIAVQAEFTEIDHPTGRVAMSWDGEAVRALLGGEESWSGVWDLQILLPGKTLPTTPLAGKWVAQHDVTREP